MAKLVYWVILVVLICAGSLSADTYYVDDSNGNDGWNGTSPVYVSGDIGPFKTIGRGMQCRDRGDIIIVADGIYRGDANLQLQFYDIVTLKSAKGPDKCILNFSENDYHWYFNNDANALISGFIFRGIRGQTMYFNEENETVIDNCIFENNMLDNNSSLIKCGYREALKLDNCIFRDNVFEQGSVVNAYGSTSLEVSNCQITENISMNGFPLILCESDSNVLIANTRICDNWNYGQYEMQGISCDDNTNIMITGCTITDNYSYDYFSGVVCEDAANVIITGCNISNNWAMNCIYGVKVRLSVTVDLKIVDCVIRDNTADSSYQSCAIYSGDCNSLQVLNCLIKGNNNGVDSYGDGQSSIINCTIVENNINHGICYAIRGGMPVIVNNCIVKDNGNQQIEKNVVVSYSDISDDTDHIWPGVGNINADPLFADANNSDYHLLSQAGRWDSAAEQWVRDDVSSPCIAAGDPTDWIGDELAGNGGRINMGYFGGTSQASKADYCTGVLPGDINRDCLVNFIDFALMTSDWLSSTIEQP